MKFRVDRDQFAEAVAGVIGIGIAIELDVLQAAKEILELNENKTGEQQGDAAQM